MTILLLGFMLGMGDKMRKMLRSYLIISCGCGLFFLFSTHVQAAYIGNYCGDGRLAGTEECDDGNNTKNDGCDHNCHLEEGGATGATATGGTTPVATDSPTSPVASKPVYYGKVYRSGRVAGGKGGKAIAPIFSALASLSTSPKYALAPFFKGNHPLVYRFIASTLETLSPEQQQKKMFLFLANIKKINANVLLLQYDIDVVTLVEVVEAIMKKFTTPTLHDLTSPSGQEKFTRNIPMPKEGIIVTKVLAEPATNKGTPVALAISDTLSNYTHADRHFNGQVYSCTYQQCENAVQYMPSGKQTISVTVTLDDDSAYTDEVTITIP